MNKNIIFAMALAVGATSAHAALVLGELEATQGVPVNNVVSGDLLETSLDSTVGDAGTPGMVGVVDTWIADGELVTGPKSGGNNVLWVDAGGALQTDFYLDTSVNTSGYNINDVRVIVGWDSSRAQAGYTLSYSLVGSTDFTVLGTVGSPASLGAANNSSDWTFVSRSYDDAGGTIIAGGVDAIRFDWDFTDNASDSATRGPVFQEIDVIGSAIPEPATLGLVAAFGGGIFFIRRRFMI